MLRRRSELSAFETGNPFLGTNLVEVSIWRDFGALHGVKSDQSACPAYPKTYKLCVLL